MTAHPDCCQQCRDYIRDCVCEEEDTMTDQLPAVPGGYEIAVTPLKSGGRADVQVTNANETPAAFTSTDIVGQLRSFFDQLEQEADAHKHSVVAMVNALARMEALLADVRLVTNTIRMHTANALDESKIRRITVSDVATMEGTSAAERTDWQDQRLMLDMLQQCDHLPNVNYETGEILDHTHLAATILSWVRVQWRQTPIKDAGLDLDDYSSLPRDEDGKPIRTPNVRIHDNTFRKQQITSTDRQGNAG